MSESSEPAPPAKPKPKPKTGTVDDEWKNGLTLLQQDLQLLKDEAKSHVDVADRVRGRLYLVSLATAAIVHLGAVPTKFETLGIEFSDYQRASAPIFLGVIAAYLTLRFYFAQKSADHYGRQIAFTWGYLHGMSENVLGHRAPTLEDRQKEATSRPKFSLGEFLQRRVPVIAGGYATLISAVPFATQTFEAVFTKAAPAAA